jgi:hypothetical protein
MQIQGQEFEVYIRSNSSSAEEWKRAMEAPVSELQVLNEEQKKVAKKFEITEEEYARGELAGIYGRQRLEAKGARLGSMLSEVLAGSGSGNRLVAVSYEGIKLRWLARFQTPRGVRNISLPYELVDDVIDSELFESHKQLREKVAAAISE